MCTRKSSRKKLHNTVTLIENGADGKGGVELVTLGFNPEIPGFFQSNTGISGLIFYNVITIIILFVQIDNHINKNLTWQPEQDNKAQSALTVDLRTQ